MTCELCLDEQKGGYRPHCEGINYVEECPFGEVAKLSEENQKFWWLFQKILPGLFDEFGGIRYRAITEVFEIYPIPKGQRPVVFDRCLAVIRAIKELKNKRRSENNGTTTFNNRRKGN